MSGANALAGDPFSLETLTAAVNLGTYRPGQVSATGLFEEDSITTTVVSVELRDGQLSLVEPSKRGGPGETVGDDNRDRIPFEVPHFERNESVLAEETQNVRAFGSENAAEVVEDRVVRKAQRHAQDMTMTLEHQRVGALKGIITSKSGKVIHNLYTAFGIAVPNAISLELDVDSTDVGGLFQDVVYGIEDDLDEPYGGLHIFTGRAFHKALWRHKSVRDTFLYGSGAQVLRQDVPDKFEFGGAIWERYRTGKKATADLGAPYIADDEARVAIVGVPELYITRFAPADYNATVNTPGLPFYAKAMPKPNDKGYDLEVQSNPISICTRPKTLRRLTLT